MPNVSHRYSGFSGLTLYAADFGATGNGTTDDRAAIQRAIDACYNANGGRVICPTGTCRVTRNGSNFYCLLLRDRVRLSGASRDGCILKQDAAIAASVRLVSTVSAVDAAITDITLDGNKDNNTVDEQRHGLMALGATRLLLERVTAQNFTGDGLYLYLGTSDTTVRDVLCQGNERNGFTMGGGVDKVSISGSRFLSNAAQQVDAEPGAGTQVNNVTISGCALDALGASNDYALAFGGTSTTNRSRNWYVHGNVINGATHWSWCDNVRLYNNAINNASAKPGVDVDRDCTGVYIDRNVVVMTDTTLDNLAGIYVTGVTTYPEDVKIRRNTVTIAKSTGFGVRCETCTDVEITDNHLTGAGVVSAFGSGVFVRTTVDDNSFVSAVVRRNTVRNFGANGFRMAGNTTAKLLYLDVSNNTFENTGTSTSMTVGAALEEGLQPIVRCVYADNIYGTGIVTKTVWPTTIPVRIGTTADGQGLYGVVATPEGVVAEKLGAIALLRAGGVYTTTYEKTSKPDSSSGWAVVT